MPTLHSTAQDYRNWVRSQPGTLDLAVCRSSELVQALDLHGRIARVLIADTLTNDIDAARIRAMGDAVSVRWCSGLQMQSWIAPCSVLFDLSASATHRAPLGLETSDRDAIQAAKRRFENDWARAGTRPDRLHLVSGITAPMARVDPHVSVR